MDRARLLIVADDLTGALDTGVKFAQQGIRVRVVLNPLGTPGWSEGQEQVLVAVTDSRRLPPEEAYAVVFDVVSAARRAKIDYIYKKTDSALRGNIGAELSAALAASGAEMLPFLPAYPAMGRTTVGGLHYIDGTPVSSSVFACDPFDPVVESDVCRLIFAQTDMPVRHANRENLDVRPGICVVDAKSDADLEDAGRRLTSLNALAVSAGCAGFAAFLPSILGLSKGAPPDLPGWGDGLLVVCGSVNPITRRQLDWAEAHGFMRIGPGCVPSPANKWLILDANAQGSGGGAPWSAEARRSTTDALAEALAALEKAWEGSVLLTGGDTMLRCLERLGATGLEPIREIFTGVVVSKAHLSGRDRMVISKSGGFGDETLLTDLKRRIEQRRI